MTTIAFPLGVWPNAFSLMLSTVQRVHASPFGGSEQVVDLLNDRWMISMSLPPTTKAYRSAAIAAFIAAMRGMTNTVNLYNMRQPAPRGTMRGTPSCTATSQGAAVIQIGTAGAGATLLAGDMIGAGGLLLQVASDCTADGAGFFSSVPLVNRVRKAISASSPVTWDRPTAPFRLISKSAVQYMPGYADSVSLDFAEVIT